MKTWQEGRVPNLKRVMLDNMTPRAEGTVDVSMLEDALKIINGRVETEATGNITIETAPVIGTTGKILPFFVKRNKGLSLPVNSSMT